MTYIKYQGRFVYLAGVEDIFRREVVRAGVGTKHDSALAFSTIKVALSKTVPEIFHSDQGTELVARATTNFIEQKGTRISVSDKQALGKMDTRKVFLADSKKSLETKTDSTPWENS